ncbi:hypothetical protein PLESTM_000473300 [Pleodorina starrii]|nr:hypothetical protein PLESTM_000473300 [Pleodorina starrii]
MMMMSPVISGPANWRQHLIEVPAKVDSHSRPVPADNRPNRAPKEDPFLKKAFKPAGAAPGTAWTPVQPLWGCSEDVISVGPCPERVALARKVAAVKSRTAVSKDTRVLVRVNPDLLPSWLSWKIKAVSAAATPARRSLALSEDDVCQNYHDDDKYDGVHPDEDTDVVMDFDME